jgi:CheY-like chemotaxis protein
MSEPKVNILLVEDDLVDTLTFLRGLARHKINQTLWVASDGEQALAILRGSLGTAPLARPFLIVLDLNLPRMDGWEFLAELRADPRHCDSIVFVLTTSGDERHRAAAYRWNVAGYMVKTKGGRDYLGPIALLAHYWRLVELP